MTTTTWAAVRGRIREITRDDIADVNGNYRVSDGSLLDYTNYAIDLVATRHSRTRAATLAVVSLLVTLPADALVVTKTYANGVELEETSSYMPAVDEYMVLGDQIKVGSSAYTAVDVLYQAGYDYLVDDMDLLDVPRWLVEPITYHAVARTLSQLAVGSGDVSQWDTRTDSGNPEHNPLLQLARYYEQMADRIMNRYVQR